MYPFFFFFGTLVGSVAPLIFFFATKPEVMKERLESAEENMKKARELERMTKLIRAEFEAICTVQCPHCKKEIDCTKF